MTVCKRWRASKQAKDEKLGGLLSSGDGDDDGVVVREMN